GLGDLRDRPISQMSTGQRRRVFLARALSYRHELRNEEADFGSLNLTETDDQIARALGLSLWLAHSLSASLPGVLPKTKLKVGKNKLKLFISPELSDLIAPIIEKRLAILADTLGLEPKVKLRDIEAD
ncbi:MAG: hypothetical protein ACPGJJ_03715, partial [Parvibaculales bacterium]